MSKKEETIQTSFSAVAGGAENEYDVNLEELTLVEIKELEGKVVNMVGAFTATSKKWPDSRYAILLLDDDKFTMGGSIVAAQVDEYKKQGLEYPATALISKRTSKKTGKDYFALG